MTATMQPFLGCTLNQYSEAKKLGGCVVNNEAIQ